MATEIVAANTTTTATLTTTPKVSFFHKLATAFEAFWHKAIPIEVQIASTLKSVAPEIEIGIDLINPAVGLAATPIINSITTGLAALSVVTAAGVPTGTALQNAQSIVASLQSNLGALESAAAIKDPATQAKLASVVATVQGELTAISTVLVP